MSVDGRFDVEFKFKHQMCVNKDVYRRRLDVENVRSLPCLLFPYTGTPQSVSAHLYHGRLTTGKKRSSLYRHSFLKMCL